MKKKTNLLSTDSTSGTEAERLKPLSNLKTRCRDITVGEYIRLICENDLSVLVLSGSPDESQKETARMEVLSEFSELSGNENTDILMTSLGQIYQYRAQYCSYVAAMVAMEYLFEDGKEFFRTRGVNVSTWNKDEPEIAFKRIKSELKAIEMKMAAKVKEYNSKAAKVADKSVTAKDIRAEMAVLSKHQGHSIADDCNLEMYAGYRMSYNHYIKAMEHAKQRVNPR